MIGIYKITNKHNGKSYIGQSIHCGKRLDEHCSGEQFIDKVIQLEGVNSFTFDILREATKEELSYWEDYYIMKYNSIFPNGYNQRWNCNAATRDAIRIRLEQEQAAQAIQEQDTEVIEQAPSLSEFFEELNRQLLHTYYALLFNAIHFESEYYWNKNKWNGSKVAKICGINHNTWYKYKEIFEKYNIITYKNNKIIIKNIPRLTDFISFQDFLELNDKELYILWKIRYENSLGNNVFYLYELFWKQHGNACSRNVAGVREVLTQLSDKGYIDVEYPEVERHGVCITLKK